MKRQQFYLPQSGKLVTQLPGGITFAYDLRLGHLRDRWKDLAEEYINKLEERCYRSSRPSDAQKNVV